MHAVIVCMPAGVNEWSHIRRRRSSTCVRSRAAPGTIAHQDDDDDDDDLSRALRVKHETSISEYLVREWGPHLELGVGLKKRERAFV